MKQAAVTGTDGIEALIYVVPQPDSPVEILSVDLAGAFYQVNRSTDGRFRASHNSRFKVRIRNRSSVVITFAQVMVGSHGTITDKPLNPGQEIELSHSGGSGFGGGKGSPTLLINVDRVGFAGCTYQPSMRFPTSVRPG